jgi:predicted NBD/HSP70 family sugar kinase
MIAIPAPKIRPPLDPTFLPASLAKRAFDAAVQISGQGAPLQIALERNDGQLSVFESRIFSSDAPPAEANFGFVERLVKSLIWMRGGWKLTVSGPAAITDYLARTYVPGGLRAFDSGLMRQVYEKDFLVEAGPAGAMLAANEQTISLGGHLNGCRIGFDAGASDRKVAAVIDGEVAYSEEVIWDPKPQTDPTYHYQQINTAFKTAAQHLPRVDGIGVSAAGIYINNRVRVASLFRGVPQARFEQAVVPLFLNLQKEWGVPLEVCNDGDVTALAGSMGRGGGSVLGIAMGSSEAGGYVHQGNLTGWLNELAFVPIDWQPNAPVDEWSGDVGCGAQYFSQVGAIRLAKAAGIELDESLTLAEKLKQIQALQAQGDKRTPRIFQSIGIYLGYALAYYADFYDIQHALILGRVTSGEGGEIILREAQQTLKAEFPELAEKINLTLPGEAERRVGQAIAAASLPVVG